MLFTYLSPWIQPNEGCRFVVCVLCHQRESAHLQVSREHVLCMETHLSYAVCSTWMWVEYMVQDEDMPSTSHLEPDNTPKLLVL